MKNKFSLALAALVLFAPAAFATWIPQTVQTAGSLSPAASLSGTDIVLLSQDGGTTLVRTTNAALAAWIASQTGGTTPGLTLTAPATGSAASTSTTITASGGYTGTAPTTVGGVWNPGAITATVTGAAIAGGAWTETVSTPTAAGTYSFTATGTGGNTASATITGIVVSTPAATAAPVSGTPSGATVGAALTGLTFGTIVPSGDTAYASITIGGVEQTPRVSYTTAAPPTLTPATAGSATVSTWAAATGGTALASTSAFTVAASSNMTVTAVTPTMIGTVGSPVSFSATINSGGTCVLPSSVTVDGTAVTPSSATTIDGTHCGFTVVGPAVSTTSYAAHTIVAYGAGTGASSNATSLFLAQAAGLTENIYVVGAAPTAVTQGSGGGYPAVFTYIGVQSGDTGTYALKYSATNATPTTRPSWESGTPTSILLGYTTSKFVPPGPLPPPAAGTSPINVYLYQSSPLNTSAFWVIPGAYTWSAGTYCFMYLTPDGGVFVYTGPTSGTCSITGT